MAAKKDETKTQAQAVGHPGLHPLPDSLPGSLWADLAKLFRGELNDAKYCCHLALHCAGYALRMWEGEDPMASVGSAGSAEPLTRERAATFCDEKAAFNAEPGAGDIIDPKGAVPWLQLALLAIQLFQEWLKKQG